MLVRSVSSMDASTPKNFMIRRKGMSQENPKPAAPLQSIAELDEGGGEFSDGFQEEVGFSGAEAFFCGERAEYGDGGAYAGAASHLQVFGGVAYIDGVRWSQAHLPKGES